MVERVKNKIEGNSIVTVMKYMKYQLVDKMRW